MLSRHRAAPLFLALALAVSGLSGCAADDGPAGERRPAAPDLSSPERAVRSYLDWISYAYRTGAPDEASPTATSEENVRIDSYVRFNLEQGRAIEQTLTAFRIGSVRAEGGTATVTAAEEWRYRYVSAPAGGQSSPVHGVSYDTTYTVVRAPDGRWRVDSVEARAAGEVR